MIRTPDFPSSFTNNWSVLQDPTHPLSLFLTIFNRRGSHCTPCSLRRLITILTPGAKPLLAPPPPFLSRTPFIPLRLLLQNQKCLIQALTGQSRRMWRRRLLWWAMGSRSATYPEGTSPSTPSSTTTIAMEALSCRRSPRCGRRGSWSASGGGEHHFPIEIKMSIHA
jgi:hypothetical protein